MCSHDHQNRKKIFYKTSKKNWKIHGNNNRIVIEMIYSQVHTYLIKKICDVSFGCDLPRGFFLGDTIGGATVLFLGVPRGLLGVPFFQFLGVPRPDWGSHDFQFLGVPLFDWGSHKNMKIWKIFSELIFFRENDEVLKLVLRYVFSIHNDKLSIWDIFTNFFSFFWM